MKLIAARCVRYLEGASIGSPSPPHFSRSFLQAPALGWIVIWRSCGESLPIEVRAGEGMALPGSQGWRVRLACEVAGFRIETDGDERKDGKSICGRRDLVEESLRDPRCRLRGDRRPGTETTPVRSLQIQNLEGNGDTHGQADAQEERPPARQALPLDSNYPHPDVQVPGPNDWLGCYTGSAALSTLASAHVATREVQRSLRCFGRFSP